MDAQVKGKVAAAPTVAKQHFHTLDGLRGVAALSVMLFHKRAWVPGGHLLDHAFLAVDFFLILSGFVVAHAYERKLAGGMGLQRFAAIRLFRLLPMVAVGSILGGAYLALEVLKHHSPFTMADVGIFTVLGALAIPSLPMWADYTFPSDGPVWSVCCELVINGAYAVGVRALKAPVLIAIVVVLGVAEMLVISQYGSVHDLFLAFTNWPATLVRAAFPFAVGLLIYRLRPKRPLRLPIGLVALTVVIVLTFLPTAGLPLNGVFEALCIAVVYPAIVFIGADHQPGPRLARVADFGGRLSYPLYAIHAAVFMWMGLAAQKLHFVQDHPPLWFFVITAGTALGAAIIAMKLYDEPFRALLGNVLKRGTTAGPRAGA